MEWVKNDHTNKLEIYVSIPIDENINNSKRTSRFSKSFLDKRKETLREALLKLVDKEHCDWLKANNLENYDISVHKCWHSGFKLHEVSDN